jgi:tRNA (guanine-N7-)-methyltransferase
LLLGLETRRKWVGLARRRAAARGLGNVEPWFGDARAVLGTWGPPGAFAAIFVNFPDPWWKKRHQKRLVVEAEAVGVMARLLRPGGALFVQTDVAERAAAYRAVLEAEPRLHEARGRGEGADGSNPFGVASHREGKCLEAGLPVFRLLFERGL